MNIKIVKKNSGGTTTIVFDNTSLHQTYTSYQAGFSSQTDYYSFGSEMPGRVSNQGSYRFGFNGQEKSDEIAGTGNHNTAEFWEYDTRLGRRWNLDPVDKPWQSRYHAFSNSPIWKVDPNGANDDEYEEKVDFGGKVTKTKIGDLGGDKVDFTHITGGTHNGQTRIESRATGKEVYMKSSSGLKGYSPREDGLSWDKLFDEFKNGTGPEKSLITNTGMLQEIMKSPQFAEAFQAYIDAGTPDKMSFKPSFGIPGAYKAGSNMTAQFIGKAAYSFYNIGDNLVITIMDSKSLVSYKINPLAKILPEDWVNVDRVGSLKIPYSTTRQTYLMILPIKK